ncbi:TPR repeat-containing protein [Thiomicrorhabdus immobilis]|uniref:TPR repeat-containing protein n=1 Tax=Thiomicrorhabdus immobilis TaxID=2791037 RepID=A0ABN6CXL2_9GAMM|nr:tetratricopeptide repeat protein [Thiomicrorhabdus immobilis]BCN92657.1 TPR repeat-containing protein [Thiomicrorhabdus immobilis]
MQPRSAVVKWSFFAGLALILSGCALTSELKENESTTADIEKQTVVETPAEKDSAAIKYTKLDSPTMFEILAAEMMVQKGQMAPAFEILYPLAQKTQDKALAERVFQISMATYDIDNIEKATELWRTVSPESAVAWRASFLLSLRNNQIPLALEQWETFHSLSKTDLYEDLTTSVGKVVASVPKDAGLEFFRKLSEKYDQAWSSYYALAMAAAVYQEPQIGISAVEKARSLLPRSERKTSESQIYHLMSKLYLLGEEPLKGIEALESYVDENPQDLLLQERFARLQVQAKQYEAAEQRYQSIIKAEPKAYTSRLSLALIQLERKAFDEAEQNLLKVIEEPSYIAVGNYYLGILYQDSNRFKLAETAFKKVVSPSYYVDAQLHLSEIYFAQGNASKAYATLDAMPVTDKLDRIKVLRAKAIFYGAEAKYFSAIDLYDQALKIEPNNIDVLKAQSMLFFKVEKFTEYEANLLKVLKQDDNDVDVLNALGYFYVEQHVKLEQAYTLLTKALSLSPDSYYILDSLGWYYYQLKQYDQALDYLNKAFKVEEDEEVLIHLVTAYWHNNQINRAKSLWQKYHQKFSQNERVQNLINELELKGSQ